MVETGVQENVQAAHQESTTNTLVSMQLSNDEMQGLTALIKESDIRRTSEIINKKNNEPIIRQNITRIQRNIHQQSPTMNYTRNLHHETSENRPTRLFSEENNY